MNFTSLATDVPIGHVKGNRTFLVYCLVNLNYFHKERFVLRFQIQYNR